MDKNAAISKIKIKKKKGNNSRFHQASFYYIL